MKNTSRSPIFIGSMFIGLGLGLIIDQVPGGLLLGMGLGYLLTYFCTKSPEE